MPPYDVTLIGAGAAGLFCAALAGQRGLRVLLIDHAPRVAEKIRISGGGRCNFTNRGAGPEHFLSDNPRFCRSALARYTPADFLALVQRHRIGWHEKHKGQLFCDDSSQDIIDLLLRECERGGVTHWQPCRVDAVRATGGGFELDTTALGPSIMAMPQAMGGTVRTRRLVVATGGLSIPKIGATDFGYRLARQFGHRIVPTRPALVPLTFDAAAWAPFADLAGVALPVAIETGSGRQRARFLEDLLFTHRGLSGPAVLQISSFWQPRQDLRVDLSPQLDLDAQLIAAKGQSRRQLGNELAVHLPARLAQAWLHSLDGALDRASATPVALAQRPLPEVRDRDLHRLAQSLHDWRLTPSGTEGYRKAEVTAGGVDTRELSSQTLESQRQPGLHFIGEVVDVTGWLGGYNFQWAWASAAACAEGVNAALA